MLKFVFLLIACEGWCWAIPLASIDQQRNGAASRTYRAEVAWRFGRSAEHATVSRGYITRYGRAADATALEIYYPFGIAQDRFMIVDTYGINLRFFKSLWWGIAATLQILVHQR